MSAQIAYARKKKMKKATKSFNFQISLGKRLYYLSHNVRVKETVLTGASAVGGKRWVKWGLKPEKDTKEAGQVGFG